MLMTRFFNRSVLLSLLLCIVLCASTAPTQQNGGDVSTNADQSEKNCLHSMELLVDAIKQSRNRTKPTHTVLRLCSRRIEIEPMGVINASYVENSGIGLSFTDIHLKCGFSDGTCVLDGRGSSRIFVGRNATFQASRIEFRNARQERLRRPTNPMSVTGGSAIHLRFANVTLDGSTFVNNTSTRYGGAAFFQSSDLTLIGSVEYPISFRENTVAGYGGGLALSLGRVASRGPLEFIENVATGLDGESYGGGMSVTVDAGDVSVDLAGPSYFSGNRCSTSGGAIFMVGRFDRNQFDPYNWIPVPSSVSLNNLTCVNNTAERWGGCAFFTRISNVTLLSSTLANNSGRVGGIYCPVVNLRLEKTTVSANTGTTIDVVWDTPFGGIYAFDANITIESSLISNNFGVGIYVDSRDDEFSSPKRYKSRIRITNSTVSNNVFDGKNVWMDPTSGGLTLLNAEAVIKATEFTRNRGYLAGAIAGSYGTTRVELTNCTFAFNTAKRDGNKGGNDIFFYSVPDTSLLCHRGNVFCSGLNRTTIGGDVYNTNCFRQGKRGQPGVGSCPKDI